MKQEFDTIEEAQEVAEPLIADGNYNVLVGMLRTGKFEVQWERQKTYVAMDGKEYSDEIWVTQSGEIKSIQDMEPEHVRNVLRMMIRNQRMVEKMMESMGQMDEDMFDDSDETRILH